MRKAILKNSNRGKTERLSGSVVKAVQDHLALTFIESAFSHDTCF